MAITNKLVNQVDLPVWEWLRFAPTATTAISATCMGEGTDARFLYYIVAAVLYRYDTLSDSWMQLATANVAPTTRPSLRYAPYAGHRGRVLSCPDSTHIQIAGLNGELFKNYKIRIISGTGMGQEKTVSDLAENVIHDTGFASTASALLVTDATKRWKYNQWVGYQVRLVYGSGSTQIRKILHNSTDTLYFSDPNYQIIDPWNNTGFAATTNYAVPVSATTTTSFYIESKLLTVDTSFSPVPDSTSRYAVISGGIWLLAGSATPFGTLQFYDLAADAWYTRTFPLGIWAAAPAELGIEKTGEFAGTFDTGTASSGTALTLTDSSKTWEVDRWANYQLRITSGIGKGNQYRIIGNTPTTLHLDIPRNGATLNETSVYSIYADTNTLLMFGNYNSALMQYHQEADQWAQGGVLDYGTNCANGLSTQMSGWMSIPATGFTRTTGLVTGISSTPTSGNKGSGYAVGDILNCSVGGTACRVMVESISTGGAVETLSLVSAGTAGTFTATNGKATTAVSGMGSGCQIDITSVGTVIRVATTANHFYEIGDSVVLAGATDSTYNTAHTIVGVPSLTGFEVINAAAATAVGTASTTNMIVDAAKNWTQNSLTGMMISVALVGTGTQFYTRRIDSNTTNTITIAGTALAITPLNTTKYIIHDIAAFGRAQQYKAVGKINTGWATGGSDTTIVDSTKNWNVNQWNACKVQILTGVGRGKETTIASNTATTLTLSSLGIVPDATCKYRIMDTFGICTGAGSTIVINDSAKLWTINQWVGKRFKITGGAGQGNEITITGNTATSLSFAAVTGLAPDTTTTYSILDVPPHGLGTEFVWINKPTKVAKKGREIWRHRGAVTAGTGVNAFDIYDIPSELWKLAPVTTPQSESMASGSMYTYDGADSLLFTKEATGRIYQLTISEGRIRPCGTIPYGMGAALVGNRMEVLTTVDGLKYLYVLRHTGAEMWRTLLFWI